MSALTTKPNEPAKEAKRIKAEPLTDSGLIVRRLGEPGEVACIFIFGEPGQSLRPIFLRLHSAAIEKDLIVRRTEPAANETPLENCDAVDSADIFARPGKGASEYLGRITLMANSATKAETTLVIEPSNPTSENPLAVILGKAICERYRRIDDVPELSGDDISSPGEHEEI